MALEFFHSQAILPTDKRPLIDLLFGVESPKGWHRENMRKHPGDYALIPRIVGAGFVNWIQERGPGVYFNTYVPFDDRQIKYGVVSLDRLQSDLINWDSLFLAGRLQKPIVTLSTTADIEAARKRNLEHALTTALLLLPKRFSEKNFLKLLLEYLILMM